MFSGHQKPHLRGIVIALSIAVVISVYSAIDGAAVKHTPTFPYATIIFFLAPIFMTPFMLSQYRWDALKAEFLIDQWRIILIGVLIVSAYLLALLAYSLAPVSYSGAVREVSVVIGAFAGWRFLGEELGRVRLFGALVIFAGILIIAMYG